MTEYEIKRLKLARITTGAVLAILVIALIAAAALFITVARYENRVERIVSDLESVTAQLGDLEVEHLVATVNSLSAELEDADVENIIATLENLSAELESIPWTEVAENFNGLAVTARDSLGQLEESLGGALESLNSLDIDNLNAAIADLQAVIEPLAKFVGRFG